MSSQPINTAVDAEQLLNTVTEFKSHTLWSEMDIHALEEEEKKLKEWSGLKHLTMERIRITMQRLAERRLELEIDDMTP